MALGGTSAEVEHHRARPTSVEVTGQSVSRDLGGRPKGLRGTPRHPLGVFGLGADFRVRGGGFLEGCSPHRTRRTLRRSCKWTLLARTEGRLGVRGGRPEWPSWLHRGSEGRPGHPLSGSGGGLSWL